MKLLFNLLILSLLTASYSSASYYKNDGLYISIKRTIPDELLKNGSWETSWMSGKQISGADLPYVEESFALNSYGFALNKKFRNHHELFKFLKGPLTPEQTKIATEETLKLFGIYSVATSDEHLALEMVRLERSNDPIDIKVNNSFVKKFGSNEMDRLREIARQFNLKACRHLLNLK